MKPALLIIDVQREFFDSDPVIYQSMKEAIGSINHALLLFRNKKLPIVCIQHRDDQEGLVPGTIGFDLPQELDVLPTDLHIVKTYGNAFNKTNLLTELQKLGVDTLIITGYCAEYCVLNTCRGAKDVDLTPILLRGALASGNPQHIRFVEEINDIISLQALKTVLN